MIFPKNFSNDVVCKRKKVYTLVLLLLLMHLISVMIGNEFPEKNIQEEEKRRSNWKC